MILLPHDVVAWGAQASCCGRCSRDSSTRSRKRLPSYSSMLTRQWPWCGVFRTLRALAAWETRSSSRRGVRGAAKPWRCWMLVLRPSAAAAQRFLWLLPPQPNRHHLRRRPHVRATRCRAYLHALIVRETRVPPCVQRNSRPQPRSPKLPALRFCSPRPRRMRPRRRRRLHSLRSKRRRRPMQLSVGRDSQRPCRGRRRLRPSCEPTNERW